MKSRDYQSNAHNSTFALWAEGKRKLLGVMPTGCHEPLQGILMFDGTVKHAFQIRKGDLLMGSDSKSRKVLKIYNGISEMVTVCPVKGDSFKVTHDHILSLVR